MRGLGDQVFAAFEVAIDRSRGDARAFSGLGEGKARGASIKAWRRLP